MLKSSKCKTPESMIPALRKWLKIVLVSAQGKGLLSLVLHLLACVHSLGELPQDV